MRKKNQEYMKQPTRTKQLIGKSQLVEVNAEVYISFGLPCSPRRFVLIVSTLLL